MQAVLQALLVTFREGLESFLIIGIIAAYLRKTGRQALIRGIHVGLGLSVLTSAAGAMLWGEVPNQPLYEGIGALIAAAFVGALLWQMSRIGRHLKSEIEAKVERAAGGATTVRGMLGVALLTAVMVTREMVEALFVLRAYAFESHAFGLATGAALGILLAGALALTWSRIGHRLQMGAVLRVTAIFLALFLVQLLVYGVHELAESGVIQGSQAFHDATERFGPDGDIGQFIAFSPAAAPLLYLLIARGRRTPPPSGRSPAPAAGA
jgi:high-affinity iron transporter